MKKQGKIEVGFYFKVENEIGQVYQIFENGTIEVAFQDNTSFKTVHSNELILIPLTLETIGILGLISGVNIFDDTFIEFNGNSNYRNTLLVTNGRVCFQKRSVHKLQKYIFDKTRFGKKLICEDFFKIFGYNDIN